MWLRCAYWLGVVLIAVAIAAVPSVAIVPSYVGGSALIGSIKDGRYFVDPGHNGPIVEVSGSTWRTVYWVERLWPLSALVPGWIGMFLTSYGMGPNWKPPPPPPAKLPPRMLWACLWSGWITLAAGWLCWVLFRAPWAAMLVGWIMFCISTGSITWWYTRSLRQQASGEQGDKPDRDHDIG